MTPLQRIDELPESCYCDGYVAYRKETVLLSVFGNYTLLQQFRARLSLPSANELSLQYCHVGYDTLRLDKNTKSLISKVPHEHVRSLAHCLLYHPLLATPDKVNHKAYVLQYQGERFTTFHLRLWKMVQYLSDIPLLDGWRKPVLDLLRFRHALFPLGDTNGLALRCCAIELYDGFIDDIGNMLTTGKLIA